MRLAARRRLDRRQARPWTAGAEGVSAGGKMESGAMRRFLAGLAGAAAMWSGPALAAPADDAAVVAQVERFFGAMKAKDVAALQAILLPDAMLTSQRVRPEGTTLARFAGQAWAADIVKAPDIEERMWDPVVMRRGRIAMVWAPYEFLRDGKVTHCGVDVFDLVQGDDGGWRIAHLMWTQEPQGCAELKAARATR